MSDPTLNVQLLIDNVFRVLMPSESGRVLFRIKGISERWIGSPAWYLWFHDFPGSFLLEIREACLLPQLSVQQGQASGNPDISRGILGIKYYPDVQDQQAFRAFSPAEREVRASGLFDATGTPAFDHASHIPETLFDIGAMEILVAEGRRFAVLSLHAPSVWRVYRTAGRMAPATQSASAEILDRDVPSWSWSWFLFNRLVAAFCFVYRVVPAHVDLLEQEGNVFLVDSENDITERSDPSIVFHSLLCGFMLPDELFPEEKPPRDQLSYLRQQILNADHLARAQHVLECLEMPGEALPWVNPEWWRHNDQHHILRDTGFC